MNKLNSINSQNYASVTKEIATSRQMLEDALKQGDQVNQLRNLAYLRKITITLLETQQNQRISEFPIRIDQIGHEQQSCEAEARHEASS
jgi:Mg2+ and Co2+ transporter CorA